MRSFLNPLLGRLERLYRDSSGDLERALELLAIGYEIEAGSLDWIPRSGPVLITANHPFGILDGLLLATLLPRIRPDVRILANSLLSPIPELRDLCIFCDLSGERASVSSNSTALKRCLSWLEGGGTLAAFPAGEVSHLRLSSRSITDSAWNPALVSGVQQRGVSISRPGASDVAHTLPASRVV